VNPLEQMKEVLREAGEALEKVTAWRRDTTAEQAPQISHLKMRAFVGTFHSWRFVITDFSIEDQGFPEGSRGVDGAVSNTNRNLILHLTREMAQRGLELALKALGEPT
jgi:hypothetical protein